MSFSLSVDESLVCGLRSALLLEDLLLDELAEAERGEGAVIPPGAQAVVGRSRQPLRHQQLHVGCAVRHQKLVGFSLQ